MPQSLSNVLIHLVFSTKGRRPFISRNIEGEMWAYLVKMCDVCGCPSLQVGGTADHVHILCTLGRTVSIAEVIEDIKKRSSKWIKTKGAGLREFAWQGGYGAFSIGQSSVAALKRYIENQAERHKRMTFQDEFRELLRKYRIDYDEPYVWD